MSKQNRIAVIGAGVMGRDHIKYIGNEERATLAAISDPMPAAKELAASLGVPYFADHKEMLDGVELDGVIIASPNKLHIPQAYDTLERNIPTLIEKPVSDDLDAAREFAKAAEAKGTPMLVGQHRRHNPYVKRAKEIISSGELGHIVAVSMHYLIYKPDNYYDIEWRRKKGAGPILVNMVHDIDLLRYLVGEIVEIQAMTANKARGFEVEDTAVVNLRLENGTIVSITLSDAGVSPWNWETTSRENPFFLPQTDDAYYFAGTKGGLTLPQCKYWKYDKGLNSWNEPMGCHLQAVTPALPHVMQLKHFCDVVEGKAKPIVPPADAIKSVAALTAIHKAAADGGTIKL